MKVGLPAKVPPLLPFVILATLLLFFFLIIQQPAGIPVLNYHMVDNDRGDSLALSIPEFEAQMAYLNSHGYTAITPDQLVAYLQYKTTLPKKPVLITFDDGYQDVYTHAFPILQKYGFTATLFLITDVVGENPWYLTWPQVNEMHQAGFVIGSHTLSHEVLSDQSPAEIKFQLKNSKDALEWRLDTPIHYFAYPGGVNNDKVIDLLKQTGYAAAFSTDFGRVDINSNLYTLERIPIFKSKLSFVDFYLRLQCTPLIGKIKTVKAFLLGCLDKYDQTLPQHQQ